MRLYRSHPRLLFQYRRADWWPQASQHKSANWSPQRCGHMRKVWRLGFCVTCQRHKAANQSGETTHMRPHYSTNCLLCHIYATTHCAILVCPKVPLESPQHAPYVTTYACHLFQDMLSPSNTTVEALILDQSFAADSQEPRVFIATIARHNGHT